MDNPIRITICLLFESATSPKNCQTPALHLAPLQALWAPGRSGETAPRGSAGATSAWPWQSWRAGSTKKNGDLNNQSGDLTKKNGDLINQSGDLTKKKVT